jgi:hypothetical protein
VKLTVPIVTNSAGFLLLVITEMLLLKWYLILDFNGTLYLLTAASGGNRETLILLLLQKLLINHKLQCLLAGILLPTQLFLEASWFDCCNKQRWFT